MKVSTLPALAASLLLAQIAFPAPLDFLSVEVHLHEGGNAPLLFDSSDPGFVSTLDADGFGAYGWFVTNTTAATWTGVRVIFFLDADWDIATNGYSNEYGEFFSLNLPAGALPGAIAPTSWEIDEPEYVFGDIYTHVSFDGLLDNSNAVPASTPDDVSLAFGWVLPDLAPGDSFSLFILHSTADVDGIGHFDPDSSRSLFVNAFATVTINAPGPNPNPVPEPGTFLLAGPALLAAAMLRRGTRQ